MDGWLVRPAEVADAEPVCAVEQQADSRFASVGLLSIASAPAPDPGPVRDAIEEGTVAVAVSSGRVVGFAVVGRLDAAAHLEQVSVLPEFGRRGIGAALVGWVRDWAAREHLERLALTTFRDVPWNAPYYRTLGFIEVADPSDVVRDRLMEEARSLGVAVERRCAMELAITGPRRP